MSNKHTENHNSYLTLKNQLKNSYQSEKVVARTDLQMDNAQFVAIPWKQIARTHDGN
ncbi:hypothetical protein LSG31_22715 [Fodinisporobacter ferrooxydans]|uniref:Uncharacterized protein n=1 Tax=Fodinisporobacter ferrooxydans TaxID=2901836 RepID=A0ABY4CRZ0_9BACL|nr:hypothetical protein LSG31_22715 [Alicyclobacillaceae bacterium MYW30-H2]